MYKVTIAHNDAYMDETAHVPAGEFETQQEAIACSKQIVERCVRSLLTPGMTADQLFQSYTLYGEEPFIISPDSPVTFSAWDYAKQFANSLTNKF